ncbi:hypothetical protein COLO4_25360 [Corchorus olitorius]|uniref:Uncharacterized protein n=1 Tax=Corchorus olitorius TaxID=93759 RepID=A0A1R3I3A0_9ROSI|nr:hypothetical protein COLO4_25360 [Corchorus olitorius]
MAVPPSRTFKPPSLTFKLSKYDHLSSNFAPISFFHRSIALNSWFFSRGKESVEYVGYG